MLEMDYAAVMQSEQTGVQLKFYRPKYVGHPPGAEFGFDTLHKVAFIFLIIRIIILTDH